MQQYEFKKFGREVSEEELNALGAQGYQLVSGNVWTWHYADEADLVEEEGVSHQYIFQRPKVETPEERQARRVRDEANRVRGAKR